jgi:hypothetical protein
MGLQFRKGNSGFSQPKVWKRKGLLSRLLLGLLTSALLFLSFPLPDQGWLAWLALVPLILALDWAKAHPDETALRPGPDLLREFFDHVTGKRPPRAQPVPLPWDPDSLSTSGDQESRS